MREVDDTTKAIHQLVENLQRETMNPIDGARAFLRYIAATGHAQEQLAKHIGKSRVTVTQIMGILEELTRDEQAEVAQVRRPTPSRLDLDVEPLAQVDEVVVVALLDLALLEPAAQVGLDFVERGLPRGGA